MTRTIHNVRAPASKASFRTARPFPAGARADFALVADRSVLKKAPPPNLVLVADAAVPSGNAPPDFALVAERRQIFATRWPKRAFYAAIVAAVFLHLAALTPFMLRPAPPPPEDVRRLGQEDGAPDPLAVSVISEADLKRLSSDPFRQEAPPTPAPTDAPTSPPEPQAVPEPPQPPVKEASAAASPAKPETDDKQGGAAFDPAGYIAQMSDQFSFQLKQAVRTAEKREAQHTPRQSGNVNAFRPGATHQGKSDEWERKVIWALAATRPMGNGKWGSAVVSFAISESGQVQGLRLIKSSGDTWLDQGALLAVKQARMPAPPPGLPMGDRLFNIEYISLPN